jgi:hypothetical protein
MNKINCNPGFIRHLQWQGISFSLRCLLKQAVPLALILTAGTLSLATPVLAAKSAAPVVIKGAVQSEPVTPAIFSGDIRSLPTLPARKPGDAVREIPRIQHPRTQPAATNASPAAAIPPAIDPLLANQQNVQAGSANRAFSSLLVDIPGTSYTGVVPPDPVGDVGPNHYIQMVNSGSGAVFSVYNKTGGLIAGPTALSTLWTAGGACASGLGDPIVLYDNLAQRWLMSEFASVGNHLCVYISQTSDPIAGGWYLYDFAVPQFPDYHKYAVWPDAYYVSTNESDPAAYALDRNKMLSGLPATYQRFTAPGNLAFPFQSLTPSDQDGATPPPVGAPNYFMRHRDDEAHNPGANDPTKDFLEIWEFHVDFTTPANSSFTGPIEVDVSEFDSDLCGLSAFLCFPQPGTTRRLDPLREVVMWRLQYRNFGDHESLVGNLVTDLDGTNHGGIRWFELRKTGAAPWTAYQEGTYGPDEASRWMGSAAMDNAGNIALGYSVSSTAVFPSLRYAGRLATDPAGTLPQGENVILNGNFSQTSTSRWGDYSSMNVDPADDCTFWYTGEYATSGSSWGTRIASFRFPDCGGSVETIGGSTTGLYTTFTACVNQSTSQVVPMVLGGANSWDCEASGLTASSGDNIVTVISGRANNTGSIGGSVTGVNTTGAQCRNQTTAQSVPLLLSGATTWNCTASGLVSSPGDVIRMIVAGHAK